MLRIERYVPVGSTSLSSDAPGWNFVLEGTSKTIVAGDKSSSRSSSSVNSLGPTCWKCKGAGKVKTNNNLRGKGKSHKHEKIEDITSTEPVCEGPSSKAKPEEFIPDKRPDKRYGSSKLIYNGKLEYVTLTKECTVCRGKGKLPPKRKEVYAASQPGMITGKRKYPPDWKPSGPQAYAVYQMEEMVAINQNDKSTNESDYKKSKEKVLIVALNLLHEASTTCSSRGVPVPMLKNVENDSPPPWLPVNPGEQLCNLVGNWRILQRIGSHRWTTDDIVTAYVARCEILKDHELTKVRSEDKKILNYLDLGCGNGSVLQMVSWSLIEYFTLCVFGIEARLEAVNLARRSLSFNLGPLKDGKDGNRVTVIHGDFRDLERNDLHGTKEVTRFDDVMAKKFDLITGTPPYFRVDFNTEELTESPARIVTSAVINQGGMPTAKQSAPARCEFRGGIEAYCAAASTVLSSEGKFVVCENWLNNSRVYEGAKKSGLEIIRVLPIKGKETKKDNLFGVYVMQKSRRLCDQFAEILQPLSVRNEDGDWTQSYVELLESMSIPAKH